MLKKKTGGPVWDNVRPTCDPLVIETEETLHGPGPCRRCAGPKFEHIPWGGITHKFQPRDPLFRAVQAAKNSECKRRSC